MGCMGYLIQAATSRSPEPGSSTKESGMAAGDMPVPGQSFEQTLAPAGPDVPQEMIQAFSQTMTDAAIAEHRRRTGPDPLRAPGGQRQRAAGSSGYPSAADRSGAFARGCATGACAAGMAVKFCCGVPRSGRRNLLNRRPETEDVSPGQSGRDIPCRRRRVAARGTSPRRSGYRAWNSRAW